MQLESLDCRGTPVSDLSLLREMPLKCLQINGSKVPPAMLAELNSLEILALDAEQLKALPNLPGLRTMAIENGDDASLELLARLMLRKLSKLWLLTPQPAQITEAGREALQKVSPACEIEVVEPGSNTRIFPQGL
jgi:hypothetical protein